ncbi:MAG: hypothetical protein CSA72_10805 [Rhodobacterales bacterium]|nr:MAG: hypothetical protein CSA72_10805 [Rhodobacterales bacterium]
MKRILLTSTALVAFAGAAAAEVSWNGDAEIGYNDEVEDGFYFTAGLKINGSAELNNGIEAGFFFDVDVDFAGNSVGSTNDDGAWDGIDFDASDYYVYMKSDIASLYLGDTKTAAEKIFIGNLKTPVKGLTFFGTEGFVEDGDVDDGAKKGDFVDAVIRAESSFNNINFAVSGLLYNDPDATEDDMRMVGTQVAVAGSAGAFNFGMAYQDEEKGTVYNSGPVDEIFGLYVGTSLSGFDVTLGYTKNNTDDEDTVGLIASYTMGDFTIGGVFAKESQKNADGDDTTAGIEFGYNNGAADVKVWYLDGYMEEAGIEGSYDLGNGLKLYAGYMQYNGDSDTHEAYVAGEYDLGGGATLLASYGETGDLSGDKGTDSVGDDYEVNDGTTIAVSFKF